MEIYVSPMLKWLILLLAGGVITYIVNNYFVSNAIEGIASINLWHYPKLGEFYTVSYPDGDYPSESIKIKRFGSRIWGTGVDDSTGEKYKIVGHISPTRYITYQHKSLDPKKNEFGVGFLKLADDGKNAVGYVLYISEVHGAPIPVKLKVTEKL
jgi:hypothetical protein